MARRDRDQDEISTGGPTPPRPIPRPTWPLVLAVVIVTAFATHWWDRDPADSSVPPAELVLVLGSGSTVTHVGYGPDVATIEGGISVTNATGTAVTLLDLRSRGPVADLRSIDHSLTIDNGTVAEWQVALRLQCGGPDWPDGLYVRARARVGGEIESRVFYLALWRGVWGRSVSRDCV